MNKINSQRIIFLDILRLLAIFLMIEGHSFDVFLAVEYRNPGNPFFDIWNRLRGITAPIFFFTTGTVFNYLLLKSEEKGINPRIKKGIKRAFLLIIMGYLLRYPTHKIIDFSNVTIKQWEIFFTVDALHLIGIGLFTIILVHKIIIRNNLKYSSSYLIVGLIIFLTAPIINSFNWDLILPDYLSGYLFYETGAIFPIFPWIGYVLIGSYFGSWLWKNRITKLEKSKLIKLLMATMLFYLVGFTIKFFEINFLTDLEHWRLNSDLVFQRLGTVLLIVIFISLLVKKEARLPETLSKISKNSLYIYIVHLIILYGCAWFPGINKFIGKSFNIYESFFLTIIIYLSVILLLFAKEKLKLRMKEKRLIST